MNPFRQNISMRQLKGDTKSEPREIYHNRSFQDIGGRFTNISKESGSSLQQADDPYEERKPQVKHRQMQVKSSEDQRRQLKALQMEVSKEAQMVDQKVCELQKKLNKLEGQRDVIEFKLKDEKDELQKMTLKREAEYNAKEQQRYIKEIKQCELNLEKLQEKKEQLSVAIDEFDQNSLLHIKQFIVKMTEKQLWRYQKDYHILVNEGNAIEFKLKDEKDELQKMSLKRDAEFNSHEQLWFKKKMKQCERDLKQQQLKAKQMKISKEAQMVDKKLWKLQRKYRKLVNEGNIIEFKLEDEKDQKDELQKMTLKGEAEDNAKDKQKYIKNIKQCELNLKKLKEKKGQLSVEIELQAIQMKVSKEAQMIEEKLWELQKQLQKLEGQRDVIEFKLQDEKNELQKMNLKRKSKVNTKEQQRYIKEIKQCERNLDQLKLQAEAQMVDQKLCELQKKLNKLERQRNVIEFELKDEKDELQKMTLKGESEYNAKEQQRYIKKIKQCQRNLEKLQGKKGQLSVAIDQNDKFISRNSAPMMKAKSQGLPPINLKKK